MICKVLIVFLFAFKTITWFCLQPISFGRITVLLWSNEIYYGVFYILASVSLFIW